MPTDMEDLTKRMAFLVALLTKTFPDLQFAIACVPTDKVDHETDVHTVTAMAPDTLSTVASNILVALKDHTSAGRAC